MSWMYTNPDDGQELEVFHTDDGEQALYEPRYPGDPTPYHDCGGYGRRYRPDQVS